LLPPTILKEGHPISIELAVGLWTTLEFAKQKVDTYKSSSAGSATKLRRRAGGGGGGGSSTEAVPAGRVLLAWAVCSM
jgi:hypothetical protein